MYVSKWGHSLAVRLPKRLVDELDLKPGDEIDIVSAVDRRIVIARSDRREQLINEIASLKWKLPDDYKFDREQANER